MSIYQPLLAIWLGQISLGTPFEALFWRRMLYGHTYMVSYFLQIEALAQSE